MKPTPQAIRAADKIGYIIDNTELPSNAEMAEIIDHEMGGWRPIDEAPKDREIWAFNGEQARMKYLDLGESQLWIYCDELLCDVDPLPEQPTHFRELPTPPTPTK